MTLPLPQTHTYFIVTRYAPEEHTYRYPLCDEDAEMRYGSAEAAERDAHERFVPGIQFCVERVEATHTPVIATWSRGPEKDRAAFWARWWKRLARVERIRAAQLAAVRTLRASARERVRSHAERAAARLDEVRLGFPS